MWVTERRRADEYERWSPIQNKEESYQYFSKHDKNIKYAR